MYRYVSVSKLPNKKPRDLPIKALLSRLDPRLTLVQERLQSTNPKVFQLGNVDGIPASDLEKCVICIVMFTYDSYSSDRHDEHEHNLEEEVDAAKEKALYSIFFGVSNLPKWLLSPLSKIIGITIAFVGALLSGLHWLIKATIVITPVILAIIVKKYSGWFLRRRFRLFPEKTVKAKFDDKNLLTNYKDEELQLQVERTFNKCCKKMGVVKVVIETADFWNKTETERRELRKDIARVIGKKDELQNVWLVKPENPQLFPSPIFVIVPKADLGKLEKLITQTVWRASSEIPILVLLAGGADLRKLKIRVVMDNKRIEFALIEFGAWSAKGEEYEREVFHDKILSESSSIFIADKKEIILLLSPSLLTMLEILYDQLPPEYRDKLEAYYRNAQELAKRYSDKIRKTAVFICYNYLQETLKQRFAEDWLDLQVLKGYMPKYKVLATSGDMSPSSVSKAIGKSNKVIVLWGDKTQFSGNVKKEVELAESKKKPIILLDGRSDTTVLLNLPLTKGYKYVRWNDAIDVWKGLTGDYWANEK